MTAKLPTYTGEDATCAKCGNVGATTQFRAQGQCIHFPGRETTMGYQPNERLHRQCNRCEHQWDEATLNPAMPKHSRDW